MRYRPFTLVLLYSFFLLTGSVYGIGEKIITIGSAFSWELMEKRQGITEVPLIRPHPVLVLGGTSSTPLGNYDNEVLPDLYLSFDEAAPPDFNDSLGNYEISVSPVLASAAAPWSRIGRGAALFSGKTGTGLSGVPLVLKPGRNALFAAGSYLRDFSIEFWLSPQNLETGEQILSFTASKPDGLGGYIYQQIQCYASKNRLAWNFENFFFAPGERIGKSISVSGPPVLNRTWSHHLIRFDADLGLLEYLADGRLEAIAYTTSSGREGGEVYTPIIGQDCRLELGSRFSGLMDEFRIYRGCPEKPILTKYPGQGGRTETRTLDLGSTYSRLLKIEAFGGWTGVAFASRTGAKIRNEYTGNGALRYSDHAEIKFYVRISNSPYLWNEIPWIPIESGTDLQENYFQGRYIQIASDFYPGADGESSPYLSELRVIYNAAEAPPPPAQVMAMAKDGAVELSWRASPSRDVGGYMIYYGNSRGEYFGNYAILESAVRASPIDAGNRTKVLIEGLNNGALYYFAVAAYNRPESPDALPEPGEFSQEAIARPLSLYPGLR